jgi:hypothetical protein
MRAGARQTFAKVNEFLAVERRHGATLRESTGGAVWSELAAVRARYAPELSPARRSRYRIRERLWFRTYWGALLVQSVIPKRFRVGPWSSYLNAGEAPLSRLRILAMLLPRVGRGQLARVMRPSRFWLEPPA